MWDYTWQHMPAATNPKSAKVTRLGFINWWYVSGCLAALVAFGLAAWLAIGSDLYGWESSWLRAVNNWPDAWRPFFIAASLAPSSLWIGLVAVVVTFLLKLYNLAWRLAASVLAGALLTEVLKEWLARPRPGGLVGELHVRVAEHDYGFPSGHCLMITIVVLTLLPYLPRWLKWVACLMIALMALSRLYLGVHSPLDVIGGVALGAAIVLVIDALPSRWRRAARFE